MVAKVGAGREDLSNKRFGRLLCLDSESRVMPSGRRQVYWRCLCDCGNETFVRPQQLKESRTVSCGCKNQDNYKAKAENSYSDTEEYWILADMKRRCTPQAIKASKNYGDRGIRVCEAWSKSGREGYENFLNDMGKRPSPKHTIERKDVNGDYCKENCIWTDDLSLQAFNRRPKKSKTGIPGVTMDSDGYGYLSRISVNYERIYLGFFKSLYKAAEARKEAELKYYGFNLEWEMPTYDE